VAGQIAGWGDKSYAITAAQAAAYARAVQQGELSQYQLDQILRDNGPLMRRAQAIGYGTAGQRGLMNSSLAAGAAFGAMVDRAQPFALSDADAYRMAATENLAARNTAALTNAELKTRANIAGGELTGAYDRTLLQARAQAAMDEAQRMWQTGERQDEQSWRSGERMGGQDWQSGENEAQREWQTGERVGGQDWQSGENQLNRDWTSEENMHQRMLEWATTQLQTYASIGMNREQAMSQVLADIYSNPNLTAAEQRAAAANAKVVFENMYGQPWTPPEGLDQYNPWGPAGTNATGATGGTGANAQGNGYSDAYSPERHDWSRYGAAGDALRGNYTQYMNSSAGRMYPLTPEEWLSSYSYTAYQSAYNPSAGAVTAGLPDV
jgi:hypothetical protein